MPETHFLAFFVCRQYKKIIEKNIDACSQTQLIHDEFYCIVLGTTQLSSQKQIKIMFTYKNVFGSSFKS